MELTELLGSDAVEEAVQAKQGSFLAKLSGDVESLIINLDSETCRSLLVQMDLRTPTGERLVELKALRSLNICGSPKQWQRLDEVCARILSLLQPVALEELSLVGVDQMKVVRALLSGEDLRSSLRSLRLGLHGFHFLGIEDFLAIGAPFQMLHSLQIYGITASGASCKDSFCRMFICAGAMLEYLGQIRNSEEMEVLHITNAGIFGDDQQIASLLRCLASFRRLRRLKLPVPSVPLSLREVISLRLALPRLLFFIAECERVEGDEVWPQGEDWPSMAQVWPVCETITPVSVFSEEFLDFFTVPGEAPSQAAAEWSRLSEQEQRYWADAVPRIQELYRRCVCPRSPSRPSEDSAADTLDASPRCRAVGSRATPEAREAEASTGGILEAGRGSTSGAAADARRASTHDLRDWRAEERVRLRGVLAMRAADVCKEKARLREEQRPLPLACGSDLCPASGPVARATQDSNSRAAEAACELHEESSPQQNCRRDASQGCDLGGDAAPAEL